MKAISDRIGQVESISIGKISIVTRIATSIIIATMITTKKRGIRESGKWQ